MLEKRLAFCEAVSSAAPPASGVGGTTAGGGGGGGPTAPEGGAGALLNSEPYQHSHKCIITNTHAKLYAIYTKDFPAHDC